MPVLEGYWQASIRAKLKSKNRSPTVQTPDIKLSFGEVGTVVDTRVTCWPKHEPYKRAGWDK